MYEAVRQRAPVSSKAAGIATAIAMTAAAGYGLAAGFGKTWAAVLEPEPTTVATLEPEKKPLIEPTANDLNTTVEAPEAPPLLPIDIRFEPPEHPPIIGDPPVGPPPGAGTTPGPRAPVRRAPKLIAKDKPPYPAGEVRAEHEGETGLEVCVDARGRVTSQMVAKSSGHEALDAAALKWIRSARFAPGTLDGAAQAMCGASVIYEWKLERK